MKSFIALFALVALSAADVAHLKHYQGYSSGAEKDAQVLKLDTDVRPDGYSYNYETSNGIAAQESAVVKPVGEELAIQVSGSNQYTAPDGNAYVITYVADENGYQPQGAHLPTPPPTQAIPEYILRSIQYNAEHEAKSPAKPYRFQ